MDPFTMALMGSSALQGIGSIIGGLEAHKTSKANREISEKNYQLALQDRLDRIAAAKQARADAQLGTTDQYGNRAYFDPERGWVTKLTPTSQRVADQQLEEQIMSLFRDAPQRRRAEDANEIARIGERGTANALMDEFRGVRREDPDRVRAMLYDRSRMGIDEAHDDVASAAITNALRTGNSNTGAITAALSRAKGKDLAKASLDAELGAEDRADQKYTARRNDLAGLYAAFGDRASRLPSTTYQPATVDARTGGNIPGFAQEAGVNSRALISAFTNTPQKAYQSPDMGIANAISSLGSIVGGTGNQMQSNSRYNDMLAMLRKGNVGSY